MIDPHFGFSRYAERLSVSAHTFDELYKELQAPQSYITDLMINILQKTIEETQPHIICFSVPFPGNLFAGLSCGKWLKEHHPNITIVMGGGFVMNSRDEIEQAFADYRSGKLGQLEARPRVRAG